MDLKLSTVITASPEDVVHEAEHKCLNKQGFVRGAGAQHQWYLLMNDAIAASKLPMNEMVRDYLAFMLNRFTGRTALLEQLDAFDYYEHYFGKRKPDASSIQDVADMSLQFVAFFPDGAHRRHQPRTLNYVAGLGVDLYQQLARGSKGKDDWFSRAYPVMANSFGYAVILLRSSCSRFAPQIIKSETGRHKNAWDTLSDAEAKKLRRTIEHFGLIHFGSSLPLVAKNN